MRHPKRLLLGCTAALLALVLTASPAWAAPSISVTPDTDLVNDQVVTVTGSGYTPGTTVFFAQCTPGATSTSECDTSRLTSVTADSSGSFTTSYTVRRLITTQTSGDIDCAAAPGTCVLGAADASLTEATTAPLTFDPNGPLPVRFAITVTDITAVVQDNSVLVEGTVTCTEPADVFIQGRLRQVVRRRFIDATFEVSVACDRDEPFAVLTEGQTGIIKQGQAQLDLSASGFTGAEFDDFVLSEEIHVRAK